MSGLSRYAPLLGLVLLLLTGLARVGWTTDGVIEDLPAPPSADRVVFADEPLPEHPFPSLLHVEATVWWDRSDVWMAVADDSEVERCASAPASSFFEQCVSTDLNAIVMAEAGTGDVGMTWSVPAGVFHVGYGTVETPPDVTMSVEWEVKAQLNGAATALFTLFSFGLIAPALIQRYSTSS